MTWKKNNKTSENKEKKNECSENNKEKNRIQNITEKNGENQ